MGRTCHPEKKLSQDRLKQEHYGGAMGALWEMGGGYEAEG